MFIGDEVRVDASFVAASRRLAGLAGTQSLTLASHGAWGDGLARVGPGPAVPGLSKLVHVQIQELIQRDGVATVALRWQATGAAGGLFPVLDADITVLPDGEQAVLLGLNGVYRPPGGTVGATLDRAFLHRIATATVRAFLLRLATAIADPVGGLAPRGQIASR
jgi:hypothetical protein